LRYAADVGGNGDLFSGFLERLLSLMLLPRLCALTGDNLDFSSFEKPLSYVSKIRHFKIDVYGIRLKKKVVAF
jgi:hypothetical protein